MIKKTLTKNEKNNRPIHISVRVTPLSGFILRNDVAGANTLL